jgi:acylphosphatase
MIRHYNIRVSGKVQGVWFRKFTQLKAKELDVKGFVRNEPDGSVYIEAEGTDEAFKLFIPFCNQGPESAKVEHLSIEEGEVVSFREFIIQL